MFLEHVSSGCSLVTTEFGGFVYNDLDVISLLHLQDMAITLNVSL